MAALGTIAGESLQFGKVMTVKVDMGTFTKQDMVFDGGLVHEDAGSGKRRVGTYATPVRANDLVKLKTTVDDTTLVVERMAASDTGANIFGIVEAIRGNAGDTYWDCNVYIPGDKDILVFEAGTAVDTTALAVNDKVSLDADTYDTDYPHGFRVKKDATNGIGRVVNKVDAAGERVKVMIRRDN